MHRHFINSLEWYKTKYLNTGEYHMLKANDASSMVRTDK